MSNVTVQEALRNMHNKLLLIDRGYGESKLYLQAMEALEELEKCESETSSQPVGRIVQFPKFDGNLYKRADITWNKVNDQDLLYTSPQPIEKCEPVGWYCKACKETGLSHCSDPENCGGMVRTYTSLTKHDNELIERCAQVADAYVGQECLGNDIRALKGKNG